MSNEYWEESDIKAKAFSFSDEESAPQMCGISLDGTSSLSKQIKEGLRGLPTDDSFFNTSNTEQQYLRDEKKLKPNLEVLISEKSLQLILDADKEVYSVLNTNIEGEKEELKILRRQVLNRWVAPDIKRTIRKCFLGHPFSFELYKSLSSKKELLAAAESLGDGDIILEVVLFLSKSLTSTSFNRILNTSPLGIQHYASYLSTRMKIEAMKDFLVMFGRHKDAAMKQFSLLVQSSHIRLDRLQKCSKNHFDLTKDKTYVDNFVKLLRWQNENNTKLMGESVATTLSLLCSEHWSDLKGSPLSPQTLAEIHEVSDRLYDWVAFTSRGKKAAWQDISDLLITKGWLGGPRLRTELPIEHLVNQLYKLNAPQDILTYYLQFLDPLEKKVEWAKKFKLHRLVIDGYMGMRDRLGLVSYKANLNPQSEDYFYAEQILHNHTVKWKN